MNITVMRRYLTDNRRGFLAWALSITAVAAMYSSMWPMMTGTSGLATVVDAFPKAMRDAFHLQDYGTAAGYFGSTVFGLLVPILVAVFAIAAGARAVAGDEEAGTLDLVMAHPVRRTQLALSRWLALGAAIVATGALLLLVELAIRIPAGFTALGIGGLAAMSLQLVLFGLCFASIAFGTGAFTGRRAYAIGGGAYLAVVAYLCDSFLPQIDGLHWTQYISPFSWYLGGEPLKNGIQWTHCALLAGTALCFTLVGIRGFDRRDLAQGG